MAPGPDRQTVEPVMARSGFGGVIRGAGGSMSYSCGRAS